MLSKKGYINQQMQQMRCNFNFQEGDDHIRQSYEWKAMRENLWVLYGVFPLAKIFPLAPKYPPYVEPSPRNPVEMLTANLLNAMELNLQNLYDIIMRLQFNKLPILMTQDREYQRLQKQVEL